MNNLLDQLKNWWETASTSTRIMGVGLGIVLAACLSVAITIASAPSYQDLFTGLTPQDAAAIAQKLDDTHEKYQMVDNDTAIRVPAQDKDRLRMDMIRQNLPAKASSVVGSDILKEIGMSTTSDLQAKYILMADESELSATIGALSEISSASVHISPGNNSPMLDTATPASASVVVNLKSGENLNNDQVMGIANLVSKSVPSLDVKNVVVMDGNGTQLWDGGQNQGGPNGAGSTKLLAEQQFSDSMRKEMQSHLDLVLGQHQSLVSVTAELDYDQVHKVDTAYVKGPVTSTAETSENYSGGAAGAAQGGAAGASSNTGNGTGTSYPNGGGGNGGKYDKSDTAQNFQPGKSETETTLAPGGVKRLAIAVLVDQKIPTASVTSITSYLNTLAGVNPGDPTRSVTVQPIAFSTTQASNEQAQVATAAAAQRTDLMIKVGAVVLALGAMMFIFMKSTASAQKAAQQALLSSPAGGATLRSLEGPGRSEGLLEDAPLSIDDVLAEMPDVQRRKKPTGLDVEEIEEQHDAKLESIRDMVRNHPQSVTLLLKGWIAEDMGGI